MRRAVVAVSTETSWASRSSRVVSALAAAVRSRGDGHWELKLSITLDLEVDAIVGVLVVTAHGRLITGELEPLRRCLAKARDARRPVVFDFLEIDEIDSEGLRLLGDAHRQLDTRLRIVAERGGAIHLALKDTGLAHVLALHATRPALAAAAMPAAGRFARR